MVTSLKRRGKQLRFVGKKRLDGIKWKQGCCAQDALGDKWLCLPVELAAEIQPEPSKEVRTDLGSKNLAVTRGGKRLEAGAFYLIRSLRVRLAEHSRGFHGNRPTPAWRDASSGGTDRSLCRN